MARKTTCLTVGVALCSFLFFPSPAVAQLAPSGVTFLVTPGGVRGSSSAYDSSSNLFLAVGAYGPVQGRLVRPDSSFASVPFRIDSGVGFAHYPAVAYSPQVDSGRGGYLVTWHQDTGNGVNLVRARLVSATGTLLGAELTLGNEATWWETAPNVAYSTASQIFLVTWRIGAYQIRASRINVLGQNLDAAVNPATGVAGIMVSSAGGEQDPSVAYNPETGNFLVAYSDFVGGAHVWARLVTPAGAVGAPQLLGASTATYLTDAVFSTAAHAYIVGWYQNPGATMARFVNADSSPLGNPFPVSSRFATYDSIGMAYNPVTGTTLLVGQDVLTSDNGGVEISNQGPGPGVGLTAAPSTPGNFYPRVSASMTEPKWMLTTAHNFTSVIAQFATSTPAGPPVAPAMTSNPRTVIARLGQVVTFSASASGSSASVQWQFQPAGTVGFSNIAGATSPSLTFVVTSGHVGGLFRAVFFNAVGSVASTAAAIIVRPVLNDFDGDGRSDPIVWRPSTGTWWWLSNRNSPPGGIPFGAPGDVALTGDLDGDGIADIATFRPSTGQWFWLKSSTGFDQKNYGGTIFGGAGDVPMLADMDFDGRADPIIYRPSTGTWYWLKSSVGYSDFGTVQWGDPSQGDVPLIADFDGDGKADPVIWRASTGWWFALLSSSNYTTDFERWWGNSALGDIPFIGDFDGDRLPDIAFYRSTTGTWAWLTSTTGYTFANAQALTWGAPSLGDVPMLGDFDGDGKSDLTVFRPSVGGWYPLLSSTGWTKFSTGTLGGPGDIVMVR